MAKKGKSKSGPANAQSRKTPKEKPKAPAIKTKSSAFGEKWKTWAGKPGLRRGLELSDLVAAGIYFMIIFLLIYPLPALRSGYDHMHHAALLMSSLRILEGQVPYRDFFPWYGPLYHYFLAFWVWALGKDLLAIKIFLHAASPLLSMAMLILSFRLFRLSWPSRLFAVCACGAWGIDRLIHSGSTRSLLGLLMVALWSWGRNSNYHRPIRVLVFPCVLAMFFYSPDVGTFLAPAALLFAGWDVFFNAPEKRKPALLLYAAGLGATLAALAILGLGTSLGRNYLQFFSYTSKNMIWAYAHPKPGLLTIQNDLHELLYFLPWAVIGATVAPIIIHFRRRPLADTPILVPVLSLYGLMLWVSTFLSSSPDHLAFSLPPIMVLMAFLFQQPVRYHWLKLVLIALVLISLPFFDITRKRNAQYPAYGKAKADSQRPWPADAILGNVRISPAEGKMIEGLKAFIAGHPGDTVLFPLHSFENYRVGLPPRLPMEDFFWMSNPVLHKKYMDRLRELDAKYLGLDSRFMFFCYMNEDTGDLFDYLLSHYQAIADIGTTIVYEKLPSPTTAVTMLGEVKGPFYLTGENSFSGEWKAPAGFGLGYLELEEKFVYGLGLVQRFSYPEIEVYANDRLLERRQKHGHGAERIRNTPEGGKFRAYLPADTNQVKLVISFPGNLNLRSPKVELSNLRFYRFNLKPTVPFTDTYLQKGY